MIDVRLGECSIEVEGVDLSGLANESGGHRIQRVPPTERRGRVQTSTVTVAIIDSNNCREYEIAEDELKIEWYSGTGAGGQYRNKHQNSCRITHIPTGIIVTSQCRSRQNSLNEAMTSIRQRLTYITQTTYNNKIAVDRKQQVGSGMRGDKIRTYRFQEDSVKDHNTNKSANLRKVLDGGFQMLWPK